MVVNHGGQVVREELILRPETVLRELDPEEAALHVFAAHGHEDAWLDAFADSLDRQRAGQTFARTLRAWGLSQAEAARCFGVSRQAIGKWLRKGAPAERKTILSDLAAATDLLVHYLKRDRIPAVVRRPINALDGVSLLELLAAGDTRGVLAACREMFAFEQVHG